MVVQRICVQMGSDYDLVILSPHLLRRFHSNFVRFLRCDLAGFEALVPMVSHIPSHLPKLLLGGDHCSVGVMLGAVDGADKHFLVGLFIVLCVAQRPVQIIVQILLVGSFIRVFRIVDDIFQTTLYGPESGGSDKITSSIISRWRCFLGKNKFCCK